MSCGLDAVSASLGAFAPFLLEVGILFAPVCSIGSVQSRSRMGRSLGQTETASSQMNCLEAMMFF